MDRALFKSRLRGTVRKTLAGYDAFYPEPLPRSWQYEESTVLALDAAVAAVHRLSGASRLVPNPQVLLGPYVRLEAVLSSRIEGTEATVNDLLRYEVEPEKPSAGDDVLEVRNYRSALDHGMSRLGDLPLSLRLIREMHEILMADVRGQSQTPGSFRRTQNWIGPPGCTLSTASFVPPPADEMGPMLDDLEAFLHERHLPALIGLAMAHYQFEAIHPFLDGNGRVGRLLVPLVLAEREILKWPMLYLSIYFEQNRAAYYDHLLRVSQTGDFTPWLDFFLEGVRLQAEDAEERAVRLVDLQRDLPARLVEQAAPRTAIRLAEALLSQPYVTARWVQAELKVTNPTAQKAIRLLVDQGLLVEITGQPRYRLYYAPEIFDAVYGNAGAASD